MKIKLKLRLGVGLLFLLIVVLSLLGAFYISALNRDSQNILVANYNTLEYSHNMLIALDEDIKTDRSLEKFISNLDKQKKNITETGEKALTDKLEKDFGLLRSDFGDSLKYICIRKDLTGIIRLNMQAIKRKSNIAKNTAETAIWWVVLTGILCFIIAFILLINLPVSIVRPIKNLTQSIKQIAANNYKERVAINQNNEFKDLAEAFNVMAQKLEEYDNSKLAKILFAKRRIETLINKMHDPIIGLDENNEILFVNEEGLKAIGIKSVDLVGKNVTKVNNDLLKKLANEIVETKEKKTQNKSTLKIITDGKESYFEREIIEINITPTGEHNSKSIGHVIILRNITPFKELDSAKTNFIATISHEFKTPLSSIKMGVQLLNNLNTGTLNEEQINLVAGINDDANKLLRITSELLNMAQVESGNIQLSISPADPVTIMQYAVTANKIAAEQKGIKFETDYESSLPKVMADSEKTAWVLTNIISNAIRYSYDNSNVFLKVKRESNGVSLSVTDTGLGISPQYQDRVFERYFRVPDTKKEGTGLGLAISKEFIEVQGGTISLQSEYGVGSTFRIVLNVAS